MTVTARPCRLRGRSAVPQRLVWSGLAVVALAVGCGSETNSGGGSARSSEPAATGTLHVSGADGTVVLTVPASPGALSVCPDNIVQILQDVYGDAMLGAVLTNGGTLGCTVFADHGAADAYTTFELVGDTGRDFITRAETEPDYILHEIPGFPGADVAYELDYAPPFPNGPDARVIFFDGEHSWSMGAANSPDFSFGPFTVEQAAAVWTAILASGG